MIRSLSALVALTFAAPLAAKDLPLAQPIDCTLGQTCYIQNYVDHDAGPGFTDFACGSLGYDTHKGTDFALPDLAAMEAGVNVLAAAPGVVRGLRDGVPDISIRAENAPDVTGRECGNGVVIHHGDGWETQYCHLKKDSLAVQVGQRVAKGTVLGQVGLSGRTEFPHLHMAVRKDRNVVDPFAPNDPTACAPDTKQLWSQPLPYTPGGLLRSGFLDRVPEFAELKARDIGVAQLPRTAPALVLWGYFYGVRQGDQIQFEISGAGGFSHQQTFRATRNRALSFRASGKKQPRGGWKAGAYTGVVRHMRDGQEIGFIKTQMDITSQ